MQKMHRCHIEYSYQHGGERVTAPYGKGITTCSNCLKEYERTTGIGVATELGFVFYCPDCIDIFIARVEATQ